MPPSEKSLQKKLEPSLPRIPTFDLIEAKLDAEEIKHHAQEWRALAKSIVRTLSKDTTEPDPDAELLDECKEIIISMIRHNSPSEAGAATVETKLKTVIESRNQRQTADALKSAGGQ